VTLDNHRQILELLADGAFHSGEELAALAGVSRTAVWKRLRRTIDELGVDIEAVRGRGYRLLHPLEMLDGERIGEWSQREGLEQASRLEIHAVIDSTNRRLMDEGVRGAPSGSICLAEYQTDGRGRRGRNWVSPFGGNLYLSMLYRTPAGPAALGGLSMAAGLAVAEGLRGAGADEVGLKWPNDLLWRGRKLGGLLVEVAGEQGGPCRAVIGLGLNLRMSGKGGDAIDQPWVDLEEILGQAMPPRNLLAARLIAALKEMAKGFDRGGLASWLDRWQQFDLFRDREVVILLGERRERGICRGIDERGALLLEQRGNLTPFHGGEVSLRGGE
jgi:BirA family biotin operon repressor/biotin-[acetyl-CoA-carboxylase] ligase